MKNTTLRKELLFMGQKKAYKYLESWIEGRLAKGRYSFALDDVRLYFSEHSEIANKFALKRVVDKGKILSIYKGYYIILPPEYKGKGVLPPSYFLDAFMRFLNRPYYLGLLNAAAYHGSSHQQPQEYFVVTSFPVLRSTKKKSLKINYISVNNFPAKLLQQHKTEAGYINVSNIGLTASDIIQYEKRIGGINRAATVINELAENMAIDEFNQELLLHSHHSALQRLGYILEVICNKKELADSLFEKMKECKFKLFRVPLKSSLDTKKRSSDNRWKIIVNTDIEIDE